MTDHNTRQAGLTQIRIALEVAAYAAGKMAVSIQRGEHDLHRHEFEKLAEAELQIYNALDQCEAILAAHSADARNGEGVALTEAELKSAKYLNEISGPGFMHRQHLTPINAFVQRLLAVAPAAAAPAPAAQADAMQTAWNEHTGEEWHEGKGITRTLWAVAWRRALQSATPAANAIATLTLDFARITNELRCYNPAADAYKGEHIHKVWAREIGNILDTYFASFSPADAASEADKRDAEGERG